MFLTPSMVMKLKVMIILKKTVVAIVIIPVQLINKRVSLQHLENDIRYTHVHAF